MRSSPIEDIYPLSPMQRGMLFHSLYAPESGNYHEQTTWALRGNIDVAAFSQAWQQVVSRHSALRSAFIWEEIEEPLQIIYRQNQIPLEKLDWSTYSAEKQNELLEEFLEKDRQHGFDLAEAPLMRLTLISTGTENAYFIWSHHHLLLDGWSQPIIFGELFACYEALCAGRPASLPPAQPHKNYIAWLKQQDMAEAETYWRNRLQGFAAPTPLVVDQKPPAKKSDYILEKAVLPDEITNTLQSLAQQNQITLNTILQGAWALLLSRYSGEEDVLFGATVSGRPPELVGVESMVGLFINTLPVRAIIEEEKPIIDWLKVLHNQQLESRQFEYSSLTDIQGWSLIPRDQPLFESLFVFESYPIDSAVQEASKDGDLQIEERATFTRTNFPLTLAISPGSKLGIMVGYDNGRFRSDTIKRLIGHLQTLLTGIAAKPHQPIADLQLLTVNEKRQLLVDWNNTFTPYPADLCAHELFEAQAAQHPEATAVVFGDEKLTYAQLNGRANQLARHLQQYGTVPETLIGLCINPSLEMIVGVMGILKAGGAFLPIDPNYPVERLTFMLQDAAPPIVLTTNDLAKRVFSAADTLKVIKLDADWPSISRESSDNLANQTKPEDLAYVIYTSGSTGMPKGTLLHHRGLGNFALAFSRDFELGTDSRMLQFASISFDAAVAEIFATLLSGGTLCIAPRETVMSIPDLTQMLKTQAVTCAVLPPAVWQLLEPNELPALRTAVSAGDACTPEIARRWSQGRLFANGYGPTEATVGAAWYPVKDLAEVKGSVPVGYPIANTQLYILDKLGRPLPIDVPGELHIGGVGLARGYLNRPKLTAEKFIPNPILREVKNVVPSSPHPIAELLYKTGDLCCYRANGSIEFLGRIDHQVKIRGFRIELGEIEAVLGQHDAVRQTAILLLEAEPGQKQLVAYLVYQPTADTTLLELRQYLQTRLPDYMIPAAFITLTEMPLLPNGKIDRRSLPAPDSVELAQADAYVPPRTPEEEILAGLWAQVLNTEKVGVYDNFFALGGHSLLATQLVSRIREALNIELPLRQLFESPTIDSISAFIQSGEEKSLPPIAPVPRQDETPLSFAQQRLWFLDQLSPGNLFYNIPMAIRLTGNLNLPALEKSLNEIVRRHETLRTTFVESNGRPLQQIAPAKKVQFPITDLRHLPPTQRENQAEKLALEEAQRPFNLVVGPLIRGSLLQLADDDYIAILTMHHIVSDGWSMGLLIHEIATLYTAFEAGNPSPLPELAVQYADFAHWQRNWLQGETLEKQLAYWKAQLGHSPPMLDLPTDRSRPAVQTSNGETETFELSPSLSQSLKALGQEQGVTLFMTLLAAYQTLLYRYTGQSDISVGTPIANRTRAELEDLIGFFVNTLVMRTDLSGTPSFEDLLTRVREVALGAYAHQDLPFEMLVEALQPDRDLSHTPLFQVMFVLDNAPMEAVELPGLTLNPVQTSSGAATFDLTLSMFEGADGLRGSLEYNTDLFERETIQRLIGHFQTLLSGIVDDPERPITELPLLTENEKQTLLVNWNETAVPFPNNTCIHHLIEEHAAKQPDVIAATFEGQALTYAQLNRKANQLAHHLQKQGVGPEVLVGISTNRSLEMVIGILGVLKAGGAYLPLDPTYPPERLAFMVADSKIPILLTQAQLRDHLPIAELPSPPTVICLDGDWQTMADERETNPVSGATAESLAYVIYTSGSTGKPKGTMLQHRGLCNLADAQRRAFNIRAGESRVLQFSPLSFDASVWETFMALRNGATLVLASQETLASGHDFVRLLQEERVTNVTLPPSMLAVLPDTNLTDLETIIAAGEACSAELVQRWAPGRDFFNAYGPTETTVCASMYHCDEHDEENPPIGRPIDNFQLYIFDEQMQPVPVGVPGELHVGGVGLARGYLNRPEMTAKRFVRNPFSDGKEVTISGESHPPAGPRISRLYKTGDLVRYRPDGNIEFLGRIDHQVKVRGFRIELGEIEAALEQHPDLQMTAVLAREDVPGDKRLVAYALPAAQPGPTDGELRSFLRKSLPEYMIPSHFVILEEMPLTPSAKIDRKALPAPDRTRPELEKVYVAPRNEIEAGIVDLCKDLLQLDQVGVYDNFFEIGGHSLLATQLISRIREAFQVEIPLRALFEGPTVADVALAVETAQASADQRRAPEIMRVSRESRRMNRSSLVGNGNSRARRQNTEIESSPEVEAAGHENE